MKKHTWITLFDLPKLGFDQDQIVKLAKLRSRYKRERDIWGHCSEAEIAQLRFLRWRVARGLVANDFIMEAEV